jgi:AcrR family transcriptional regulator
METFDKRIVSIVLQPIKKTMEKKILKEVGDMFMTYGVRSVSMDDISRHMGISKKTIYQYFKDKNDLVEKVTEEYIRVRQDEYCEVTQKAANAIEELHLMSKCLRKHFGELNPSLVFDLKKFYPSAWNVFVEYERKTVFTSIQDNLDRGKKEGFFRKKINSNILAKLRVEQVHMSFDPSVFPKQEFDFTQVQMEMFDHYVYGLLTEKGNELYEKYKQEN